jgi:hypothetical protein
MINEFITQKSWLLKWSIYNNNTSLEKGRKKNVRHFYDFHLLELLQKEDLFTEELFLHVIMQFYFRATFFLNTVEQFNETNSVELSWFSWRKILMFL